MRKCELIFGLVLTTVVLGTSPLVDSLSARDTVQQVQNLSVFDARGKRLGNVLGFYVTNFGGETGGAATVALRVEGELVVVYVRRDGFYGAEGGFTKGGDTSLYFESANCTGAPSTNPVGISNPLITPSLLKGTRLYQFDGEPKLVIVRSIEESSGNGNTCRPVTPGETLAQPLRFLTDLADHFQPPFTLR